MSPIIQHSLSILILMAVCAGFIQFIISKISGRGILLVFSAMILSILVVDSELLFILGQIDFTILNIFLVFTPGFLLTLGAIYSLFIIVVVPVRELTASVNQMAAGSLQENFPVNGNNEIGDLSLALQKVLKYQQEMALLSNRIADGELNIPVTLKSTNDELGLAFTRMKNGLQKLIIQVTGNARTVLHATEVIRNDSELTRTAAGLIEKSAQNIAKSTRDQTFQVSETMLSMGQMNHLIHAVSNGTLIQTTAIGHVSEIAYLIKDRIDFVTSSVGTVSKESMEAASSTQAGVHSVIETIKGMESIWNKVNLSAEKVENLGSRSEEIGEIIETIEDIASQTNLLALNAAIEAARAESAGIQANEKLSQTHLLGIAKMLSELLARSAAPIGSPDLAAISRLLSVEVLSYTDEDGLVIAGSQPELLGFRFPDDGKGQAAIFRPLLDQKDGTVVQPVMSRDTDGKAYLFVGVSRLDKKGIVQAGNPAKTLLQLGNNSRGFAVVADEVRKLAERSSLSTREIAALIKGIQKTVSEAVLAMKETSLEVVQGVDKAKAAGDVLDRIMSSVASVHQQAEDTGNNAAQVSSSSSDLIKAINSGTVVIKENSTAAEDMTQHASQLSSSMKNINDLGQSNNLAAEQVNQAVEKVLRQLDQADISSATMKKQADDLLKAIAQFKTGKIE